MMKKILLFLFVLNSLVVLGQTGNIMSVSQISPDESIAINVDDINAVYPINTQGAGSTIIYGNRGSRLAISETLSELREMSKCQLVPAIDQVSGDSVLFNKSKILSVRESRGGFAIVLLDRSNYYGSMGSSVLTQETYAVIVGRMEDCPFGGGGSGATSVLNADTVGVVTHDDGLGTITTVIPKDWALVSDATGWAVDSIQFVNYENTTPVSVTAAGSNLATGLKFRAGNSVYYVEDGKLPLSGYLNNKDYYLVADSILAYEPRLADSCRQFLFHTSFNKIYLDIGEQIICTGQGAASSLNLYTTNGTLNSLRTVDLSTFDLDFISSTKADLLTLDASSGRVGINAAPNETFGQLHVKSDNIGADGAVLSLADNNNAQIFRVRNDGGFRANTYGQGTQGWADLGVIPSNYIYGVSDNGTAFDIDLDTMLNIIPERIYKTFVGASVNLSASTFTVEKFTVPSYMDGKTLDAVYYAVNTASDAAFNMNTSIDFLGGGITNYASVNMLATTTTISQSGLGAVLSTGDVISIFVNTISGTTPQGLEVVFEVK